MAERQRTEVPSIGKVRAPEAEMECRPQPVSWSVRVWLHEDVFFTGCAIDASARAMRIKTSDKVAAFVSPGDLCRLEIDTTLGVLCRTAEIRRADRQGVDFEIRESLPPRLWDTKAPGR